MGLMPGASASAGAAGPDLLYFSTAGTSSIPGLASPYDDADIYRFNPGTGTFDRVFDASKLGLPSGTDIDALYVVDPVTFYMSFNLDGGITVPGLGVVQDEDVVLYHAGKFSWFFHGKDIGLGDDGNGEDVDSLNIRPDGSVLVSTVGTPKVGVSGALKQDILRCEGTFGPQATCNWSMYLDGSTVGLSDSTENVDALFELDGNLYFSTTGAFSVAGLTGGGDDIVRCDNALAGAPITCSSFGLLFDGYGSGVADNIDAAQFVLDAFADPDPSKFRVVVLGSSTASGTGASSPATSWVGLLDAWLGTVAPSHEIINLAIGGTTTKAFRPDGSASTVDVNRDITRALELSPDLIVVNLPTNNVAEGMSLSTTVSHYRQIKGAADAAGVPLLLTTTQPRNFADLTLRVKLQDEAVAIRTRFGAAVIDIYDELTDFGNSLAIKAAYDSGDGVHLNDAGHAFVFETMRPKVAAYVTP